MAETTQLDPADRTPVGVRAAIGENQKAFPNDDCIPCGAVVHMGFLFPGQPLPSTDEDIYAAVGEQSIRIGRTRVEKTRSCWCA